MNLLVLNPGSGSLKCSLFHLKSDRLPEEPPEPLWQAEIDSTAPGQPPGKLLLNVSVRGSAKAPDSIRDDLPRTEWIAKALATLWEGEDPVIDGPEKIDAVGHRVVHGGELIDSAVPLDSEVESTIQGCAAFAPLHNQSSLDGIRAVKETLGHNIPQVAVFDTAFHRTLSEAASAYPGPYEWLENGIRRYGFHGTSFRWASRRAARLLEERSGSPLRLILCHLSGGCSLAATIGGRSVDTTMGLTPLDGVAMCTRSGSIDPGILIYLQRKGVDPEAIERLLNRESGLKGLSGLPGDTRIVLPESRKGNQRARLAIDVFIHRLRAGMGQMLTALGDRPDAIVFTGAIGESEPDIRAAACQPFMFLGLLIDQGKNIQSVLDSNIAGPGSTVQVLVIKSQENWQIARESYDCLRASPKKTRGERIDGGIAG